MQGPQKKPRVCIMLALIILQVSLKTISKVLVSGEYSGGSTDYMLAMAQRTPGDPSQPAGTVKPTVDLEGGVLSPAAESTPAQNDQNLANTTNSSNGTNVTGTLRSVSTTAAPPALQGFVPNAHSLFKPPSQRLQESDEKQSVKLHV